MSFVDDDARGSFERYAPLALGLGGAGHRVRVVADSDVRDGYTGG